MEFCRRGQNLGFHCFSCLELNSGGIFDSDEPMSHSPGIQFKPRGAGLVIPDVIPRK